MPLVQVHDEVIEFPDDMSEDDINNAVRQYTTQEQVPPDFDPRYKYADYTKNPPELIPADEPSGGGILDVFKEWGKKEFGDTVAGVSSILPKPVTPPVDPATGAPRAYDEATMGPKPSILEQIVGAGKKAIGGFGQALTNNALNFPIQLTNAVRDGQTYQPPVDPDNPTYQEIMAGLGEFTRYAGQQGADALNEYFGDWTKPLPNEEYMGRMPRGVQSGAQSFGHVMGDVFSGGGFKKALLYMFTDVTADTTRELLKKGYSDQGAFIIGSLHGGAELVGERTPMGYLDNILKGGDWKKELVKFAVTETGQETITEGLQSFIDKATVDPNMTWGDFKERYYDMLASLPVSLGGLSIAAKTGHEAQRVLDDEGLPGTQKRKIIDIFQQNKPEKDMTGEVAASMQNRANMTEVGEKVDTGQEKPSEPEQKVDTGQEYPAAHVPPVGEKTQSFIDKALQTAGYESLDAVPEDTRESIIRDAEELHEQSLVTTDSSNTAVELRNLILEEQRKRGDKPDVAQKSQQIRESGRYAKDDAVTLAIAGASSEALGERDFTTEAQATVVSNAGKGEAVVTLSADIPELGAKAGDRVKIDTTSGQILSGIGTGPAAAARTGRAHTYQATGPGRTQASKKKDDDLPEIFKKQSGDGRTDEELDAAAEENKDSTAAWLKAYDSQNNDDYDTSILDAYDEAYDALDAGRMDIEEAAQRVADKTNMPVDDIIADLTADYGTNYNKEDYQFEQDDYNVGSGSYSTSMTQEEQDYYDNLYGNDLFVGETAEETAAKNISKKDQVTYVGADKSNKGGYNKSTTDWWDTYNYGGGAYAYKRKTPSWALDSHLADDATGEITEGSAKTLMPDIMEALKGTAITDPNMASPLTPREQNAIARVLRKMVDTGFPRAVIRSITSYGHQREKQYLSVSGAYAGLDHSVRYASYVLQDMRDYRQTQAFQKALRFLMSHELSHAIEADRNEHTLSMDSPLFHLDEDSVGYSEDTKTYNSWDAKTKKMVKRSYTSRTPHVDLKKVGPIIGELIEVYQGNSEIASVLGYPFASLSSLVGEHITPKAKKAEINRIRAEAFAQLGALSFTYPELAEKYMPKGYKFIQEVKRAANHTDRSARRRALRGPFQIQGAGRSDANIWSEAAGDVTEGGKGQQGSRGTTQSSGVRPYRYADDVRSATLKSERIKELRGKNTANTPFVREGFTDSTGLIESAKPLNVYALHGQPDLNSAGSGSGIIHAIYDVHEQGNNNFAWQNEQVAIDSINYLFRNIGEAEYKRGKIQSIDEYQKYSETYTIADPHGLSDIVVVLGYRHKPKMDGTRAPMKIISAYRNFASEAELYPAGHQARDVSTRGRKQQSIQRVVDRVTAMSANKNFDFRVIDNPMNPEFPHQIYKDLLDSYRLGNQEAFDIRGLHSEAYGRPIMYIFSDNITDNPEHFELDVTTTILHEGLGGHFVLRQYFGSYNQEFADFLDSVYETYKNEPQFIETMRDLGLNSRSKYGRRLGAEEFLSEMAETDSMDEDIATFWDKFIHLMKKMLRAIARKAGLEVSSINRLSSRDIKAIMSKARRQVHGKGFSAKLNQGRQEIMDAGGTLASRRKVYTDLYESVELDDERQYITPRQEELPFYSQLHARAAVDAPLKGSPAKFKKWLQTVQKSGEKEIVDITEALDFIGETHEKLLDELVMDNGTNTFWEPWTITKKEIVKKIKHGKFKGYVQANAPAVLPLSDFSRYLKHAQRAFRGGQVKGEEIEWVGVAEFLDMLPNNTELTRGEFAAWINAHKLLIRDKYASANRFQTTYGPWGVEPEYTDNTTTRQVPNELVWSYSETEEPDSYMANQYENEYYDEREADVEENARDGVDRYDYVDDEARRADASENAQNMADEYNDENEEAIEAGDLELRDEDDYFDDAYDDLSWDDYVDEDNYDSAVADAEQEARDDLRLEAEEHGIDTAREDADETYSNNFNDWHIQGNDNRESWRVYDGDWDMVSEDHYSRSSAEEAALEEMESADIDLSDLGTRTVTEGGNHRNPEVLSRNSAWESYTISQENYRQLLMTIPDEFVHGKTFHYDTHYSDPNIVVYVRVNDVQWDVGGKQLKALNIDELQSDWFQIGDLTAYGEETNKATLEEITKQEESIEAEKKRHLEELERAYNADVEIIKSKEDAPKTPEPIPDDELNAEIKRLLHPIAEKIDSEHSYESFYYEAENGREIYIDSDGDISTPMPMKNRVNMVESAGVYTDSRYVTVKTRLREAIAGETPSEFVIRGIIAMLSNSTRFKTWADYTGDRHNFDSPSNPEILARTDKYQNDVRDINDSYSAPLSQLRNKRRVSKAWVPKAPFHQTYTAMVMRRLAHLAVQEGYDALVVTPGEVHSGRWGSDIFIWTNKAKKPDEVRSAASDLMYFQTEVNHQINYLKDEKRSYAADIENINRNFDTNVGRFLRGEPQKAYKSWDGLNEYWNESTKKYQDSPVTYTEAEISSIKRRHRDEVAHRRRTFSERKKQFKKNIRGYRKQLIEKQRIVENWKGGTLPEGQFMFATELHSTSIINTETATKLRKEQYWTPDEETQKNIQEQAESSTRLVDINTPEGIDTVREMLNNTFQYAQGYEGGLRRHTTEQFLPVLLAKMQATPSGGMQFRRGAGLSGWYDRKMLSKSEGIRLLDKNMKVGKTVGTEQDGRDMAGVVIDDNFKKKWGISQSQFSRRGRPRGADTRKILAKVGKTGTATSRFTDMLKEPKAAYKNGRDWFLQKTLNSGLPFLRMVEQLGITPADQDPYIAWRLLAGDSAIIEDWLGVNPHTEGTVPYDPRSRLNGNWGRSLKDILSPVTQDAETLKDFEEYIIARRAKELLDVGKEKLFTEEDIEYGLSLQSAQFDAVAQGIYRYNDSLVQYAVDAGFLSEEVAVKFRRYSSYIPFFREAEHKGDVGSKARGTPFKKLFGGKAHIRDPLQNIIDNTASIIHAANRNAAVLKALHLAESRQDSGRWLERVRMPQQVVQLSTQRIIDSLGKQGVSLDLNTAEEIAYMQTFFQNKPIGDEKNRIVVIKEAGKPVAVKVHDETIWDALHAMAPMEFGLLIDILAIPAETIRTGIVMDPGFMGANMARDTMSGFIQSRKGITLAPVLSSVQGMANVATGSEIHKMYRAMGAGYADIWHGDSKEAYHSLERLARIGKFRAGTVLNPMTYWRALRRIGTITETGTRLQAFKKQYKLDENDPANALIAALEAREVSVDFSLHGVSKTLRVLERLTPFLNPAKQGLYKMGRTIGEQPLTTALRGSPIMLLSFYLWMLNRDEEWYKDLEDWEKNHYWHADIGIRSEKDDIVPLRIPKPFEYGALFGSFPEALFQYLRDSEGKEALNRVGSTIEDVFLLRGYPTALSLPSELYFNKSFFTDRPLVPGYLQGIEPRYQYGPYTSMFARKTGELTGFSPMKIDHSVRGVFGTLGMYTLMAIDDPAIRLFGETRKPSRHWWQMPAMRRFFSDPLRPNGKAMTEFYDTMNQYRMEQKTWKFLDYSQEYLDSLESTDSFSVGVEDSLQKLMTQIRKSSRTVRDSKDMTQREKREIIDENTRQLRLVSRRWKQARKEVKDASR